MSTMHELRTTLDSLRRTMDLLVEVAKAARDLRDEFDLQDQPGRADAERQLARLLAALEGKTSA